MKSRLTSCANRPCEGFAANFFQNIYPTRRRLRTIVTFFSLSRIKKAEFLLASFVRSECKSLKVCRHVLAKFYCTEMSYLWELIYKSAPNKQLCDVNLTLPRQWLLLRLTLLICITIKSGTYGRQFGAILLFNFSPKLPRIHLKLHCNANEKIN